MIVSSVSSTASFEGHGHLTFTTHFRFLRSLPLMMLNSSFLSWHNRALWETSFLSPKILQIYRFDTEHSEPESRPRTFLAWAQSWRIYSSTMAAILKTTFSGKLRTNKLHLVLVVVRLCISIAWLVLQLGWQGWHLHGMHRARWALTGCLQIHRSLETRTWWYQLFYTGKPSPFTFKEMRTSTHLTCVQSENLKVIENAPIVSYRHEVNSDELCWMKFSMNKPAMNHNNLVWCKTQVVDMMDGSMLNLFNYCSWDDTYLLDFNGYWI